MVANKQVNGDGNGRGTDGAERRMADRERRAVRMRGHPRPMLRRKGWTCLNGWWDFAIDAEAKWSTPEQVRWDRRILVPFAPETPASGIADTSFYNAVWYRRTMPRPALEDGQRLILHFGAVDWQATVWVNGRMATDHTGGYAPFQVDITDLLGEGEQTIVVRAEDDPLDLAKPRGKQDWQLQPHSIWYPRTTGIWQTVWTEKVPATWISRVRWVPNVERWEISGEARIRGRLADGMKLRAALRVDCEGKESVLSDDAYLVVRGEVNRRIVFSDPGIDDYRNELLWYPHKPTLIQIDLELLDVDGRVIDSAQSYTALRSIGVQGDRFVLNGRPYYLRMVLDQGYWPETGLSTPDDEAVRRDVELAKEMGFNGVRRHQVVSDPRFLYWADTLGLLVWEEMPSAYRFTRHSVRRLTQEWAEIIHRDLSHPCIVAWVPFNESWGVPDLPDSPAQRHCVQALYHLTKTMDPTRPVIGNDGWESVATDIIGIHDYDDNPDRIRRRYGEEETLDELFKRFRPGGRLLLVGEDHRGQPVMLTEFGGIALSNEKGTWGYSKASSSKVFQERYGKLLETVRALSMLAGFCYTQFTDTYQEANGLLFADRTPKFPLRAISRATGGQTIRRDERAEAQWRQRMMQAQREQYLVPDEDHQTQAVR